MKAGAHVVDRQIVPARQNEMEFFGLQKDALLLHIKRVRTADGEPIFEENIFVPFDAYRELLTADLEDKSIFAEVERVGGTPIVSVGYRTVEAVRANAEQAAELGIAPHDPLLNLRAGFTARAAICLSTSAACPEGQCRLVSRHLARSGGLSLTLPKHRLPAE